MGNNEEALRERETLIQIIEEKVEMMSLDKLRMLMLVCL